MDIREILAAIDEKDKQLWSSCRTNMRKVYISAHNKVVGTANWSHVDDAFLDMMDIQLANLFDRGGRLETTKPLVDNEEAEKIINDLLMSDDEIKKKLSDDINNEVQNNLTVSKINSMANVTEIPKNEWK